MNLSELTNEDLTKLLKQLRHENKYNKQLKFNSYPFQDDFYAAGKHYKRRFLCAANRVGKSYSEAHEMSLHLTGRYPAGWNGHVFDYPITAWAVGITGDSTRKVLQKELFGSISAKDTDELGTGAIPRDAIDFDLLERDGHNIKVAKIKHTSGEYSSLEFRSTQQGEHTLMGATIDFIWLDEEDPYRSMEIYAQCVTRTATTGGHVVITATPENGLTSLVDMFMTNAEGKLYFQNATWEDAPHLDDATKEELLASIPEWQREMRTKGIPLSTAGVVFPITHSKITTDPLQIDNWDNILWSIDITHRGKEGNDPTVLTLAVQKGEQYYIHHQETFKEDGHPEKVAEYIKTTHYPNAPVIIPHDAGGAQGYGAVLKSFGINVQAEVFRNPELALSGIGLSAVKPRPNDIEVGLHHLNDLMNKGLLLINRECVSLFRELTTYERTGKKGEAAYRGRDDHIDSFRYGVMSLMGYRGIPAGQSQKHVEDFNNGFEAYDDYKPLGATAR